ncbi:hypothetical protein [Uruburuella suis]|uniref:hypothetical protein n=1 Tax=Uruburuella suis TaxID=252130 RepID=UPI003F4A861D
MACIGLVYLRDGDSLIARDYRPLLQQWLPEGTKIVQTRGECPHSSEEAEYESAQVYQLTLPGKKPLWVEVGAFGKADYSPAPTLPWTLPSARHRVGHVWHHCSGRFSLYPLAS